jgi:2-polyprenyl-3-methyl-5-hydroxy-6-metoxy-1,4-benzoquinol methylase
MNMERPTLKAEVKRMVMQALELQYISESCKDRIPTGNKYQTLRFGDDSIQGFRSDRRDILKRLDFSGKKVLDLGSNLGENSRAAREAGASLVDGYEYDEYFIEIANFVNAINGVTRVSFYQRDITNAATFVEEYDIVLAFSVFTYLQNIMATVAAKTKQVLLLETHGLTNNIDLYMNCITPYLGSHRFLDTTDWGRNLDEKTSRAIIAFARDEATLNNLLRV